MINIGTPLEQIANTIATIREKKGKGEEALELINKALNSAYDFVVSLLIERHLVYQHEVMEERAKPKDKQNRLRDRYNLKKMEEATLEAKLYVKTNRLTRWESRVERCMGRVADYKGNYKKAMNHYRKAIKTAKKDPEYVKENVPRWLEYEAFLAYSLLMSGKDKKGLRMSKLIYNNFNQTKEGQFLRKKDYPTWVIWKTGIPIRVGFWYLEGGDGLSKNELLDWLESAEADLEIPRGSKRWTGKVDFGFRLDEIEAIRRKID